MTPLLYKLDASPPACAVRMLQHIIGLKLNFKEPDLSKMEHKSPEYLKVNPLGTFPVLVDGDLVICDSHAIMIYLLSKYGGKHSESLYPSDARTRALVNQCLFFDTGILFIRLKVVAMPTVMEGLKGPTEKHLQDLDEAYGMVEAFLTRNKYLAANHLTIADISVVSTIAATRSVLAVDIDKFPLLAAWYSRLEQESFFAEIMKPGADKLRDTLIFFWDKNSKQ